MEPVDVKIVETKFDKIVKMGKIFIFFIIFMLIFIEFIQSDYTKIEYQDFSITFKEHSVKESIEKLSNSKGYVKKEDISNSKAFQKESGLWRDVKVTKYTLKDNKELLLYTYPFKNLSQEGYNIPDLSSEILPIGDKKIINLSSNRWMCDNQSYENNQKSLSLYEKRDNKVYCLVVNFNSTDEKESITALLKSFYQNNLKG